MVCGLSVGLGAEYLFRASLFVILHPWQVINPFAGPTAIAFDRAATMGGLAGWDETDKRLCRSEGKAASVFAMGYRRAPAFKSSLAL